MQSSPRPYLTPLGILALFAVGGLLALLALLSSFKAAPVDLSERFDPVDLAIQALQWGSIAFNHPDRMDYGETVTVGAVISGGRSPEELTLQLRRSLPAGTEISARTLQVSHIVQARLTPDDEGLAVVALSKERQPVGSQTSTEWIWRVTAKRGGKHLLHLTVDAVIVIDEQQVDKTIRTFDQPIEVEVTVRRRIVEFASDNWQWLSATIVIPLGLYLWKRRKRPGPITE